MRLKANLRQLVHAQRRDDLALLTEKLPHGVSLRHRFAKIASKPPDLVCQLRRLPGSVLELCHYGAHFFELCRPHFFELCRHGAHFFKLAPMGVPLYQKCGNLEAALLESSRQVRT